MFYVPFALLRLRLPVTDKPRVCYRFSLFGKGAM